ncbi:MAG: YhjD/YihY/BrkB family envelope integrity protein [Planctomycetota bacterium]
MILHSVIRRLGLQLESLFGVDEELASGRRRFLLRQGKIVYLTLRKAKNDLCLDRAASLAFTSTVAAIPIAVLLFFIFRSFGSYDELTAKLSEQMSKYVAAEHQERLSEGIDGLKASITEKSAGLGTAAMIALLLSGFSLLRTAERTFAQIWRVEAQRGYFHKLRTFWLLLTAAPLVLAASVYVKATVSDTLLAGLGQGFFASLMQTLVLNWLFPLFFAILGFTLLYLYLPSTRVKISSAVAGAFVAALAWEALTRAFTVYIQHTLLSSILGALGVIPFFLIWTYLSWLIALVGGEIAYCLQNYEVLEREVRHRLRERRVSRPIAALLFLERIYRGFHGIVSEATPNLLATEFQMPLGEVEELIESLVQEGFLVKKGSGGLTPARAPERVGLIDVVRVFPLGSGFHLPAEVSAMATPLTTLLEDVGRNVEETLGRHTIADLVVGQAGAGT